ncbi:MAG TPA: polysaccharide biosynthesis/export family protein [Terriglobales bacterium]|nr:polysaccharide biosynthesis/export family protein [Terriglobales bacterium]
MKALHGTAALALVLAFVAGVSAQDNNSAPPELQALPSRPPAPTATESLTPLPLPAGDVPETMSPDLTPPAVPDNYLIGRNDLLAIFVYQMPELTSQVRVNSDGYIELPFLRRPLPASGVTPLALRGVVAKELVAEGLARDPVVRVMVRQVESRPIVVAGAVRYPEVIQAARPMRLLEVLSRAGGLENSAGTTVMLTTPSPSGSVTQEFSIQRLLDDPAPGDDPLLVGGETVRVIPARLVYAVGAFEKPGAFPVVATEPMTVLRVIALAQGFSTSAPASKGHAEIIRTAPDGSRQELPVNIDKILKHKAPDQALVAGDVLYVPEDGAHKVMTAALGDLSAAATLIVGYRVKF